MSDYLELEITSFLINLFASNLCNSPLFLKTNTFLDNLEKGNKGFYLKKSITWAILSFCFLFLIRKTYLHALEPKNIATFRNLLA